MSRLERGSRPGVVAFAVLQSLGSAKGGPLERVGPAVQLRRLTPTRPGSLVETGLVRVARINRVLQGWTLVMSPTNLYKPWWNMPSVQTAEVV